MAKLLARTFGLALGVAGAFAAGVRLRRGTQRVG
jgi:hypothetical protein